MPLEAVDDPIVRALAA